MNEVSGKMNLYTSRYNIRDLNTICAIIEYLTNLSTVMFGFIVNV